MHKGTILLTQATSREDALSKTKEFMKEYGDDKVWDWYSIGGRWSGTLNPKYDEFDKLAREIVPEHDGFRYTKDIESQQPELQKIWETLGQEGSNPWADHYKNVPDGGGLYDVMRLTDCLAVVKDWQQDPEKDGKEAETEAETRWGKSSGKFDLNMYGYMLKIAALLYQQKFSFECNIFNTGSWDFTIPADTDGWWAVIVDMHT